MKYILIETIEAYEFSKKFYSEVLDQVTWITTSPYLINYFDLNKVKFIKIEEKIDNKLIFTKVCTAFNGRDAIFK